MRETLLEVIVTPLGPTGLIGLLFALFLYINLSRRLGEVTKMPPRYRWLWGGVVFVGVALVVSILGRAAHLSSRAEVTPLTSPEFALFFYHIPLFIGVTISLIAIWKYWSWLLTGEQEGEDRRKKK